MKYLTFAILASLAVPAAANNHATPASSEHQDHAQMMCCDGTPEEREACQEQHRAMGHEVGNCPMHGEHSDHHDGMSHGDHQDHQGHEENAEPPEGGASAN